MPRLDLGCVAGEGGGRQKTSCATWTGRCDFGAKCCGFRVYAGVELPRDSIPRLDLSLACAVVLGPSVR